MKKIILIISVFILIIILMTCGWFLYYTKTPTYSLGIIKTAIEQHDLETFKEHVDIDTLLNSAIDDLIANDDIGKNALANGVIKTFKPYMIEEFKKEIYASVEDTSINQKTSKNTSEVVKDSPLLKKKTIIGIGNTSKDGKVATVEIKVNDEALGEEFTFLINMREKKDGTWQVIKVSNLIEYIKKIQEKYEENRSKNTEFIKLGDAKEGIKVNIGKSGRSLKTGIVLAVNTGKKGIFTEDRKFHPAAEKTALDITTQTLRNFNFDKYDESKQVELKNKIKHLLNKKFGDNTVYDVYITSFLLE